MLWLSEHTHVWCAKLHYIANSRILHCPCTGPDQCSSISCCIKKKSISPEGKSHNMNAPEAFQLKGSYNSFYTLFQQHFIHLSQHPQNSSTISNEHHVQIILSITCISNHRIHGHFPWSLSATPHTTDFPFHHVCYFGHNYVPEANSRAQILKILALHYSISLMNSQFVLSLVHCMWSMWRMHSFLPSFLQWFKQARMFRGKIFIADVAHECHQVWKFSHPVWWRTISAIIEKPI